MATENPFDQKIGYKFTNQIKGVRALKNHILARDMAFGSRQLSSGIVLLDDDGKSDGIRPRWCQVYAVGPEQKDVEVGQWILVEHGRWTRAIEIENEHGTFDIRMIEAESVLAYSEEKPEDVYIGQED